ncbi:hypothetical protein P3U41_06030 [Mammaliicoccus sciuri]|uniref:DUF3846 domain-containing protein n=1 Tax=Mammaliicoccus sciuri TaxID=1296 RepID=UPI002B25C1F8|nr:hypothetical protein [Mammaliicoccus sciuri]WQL34329.1 hypothetical protein P3U41_06030 [Mammaliicoccus sciuri]WQL61268.1 hypothetical protein P3T96_06030 [Mammaliicoccus sciuri]
MAYLFYDENTQDFKKIEREENESNLELFYKHLNSNTVQIVMFKDGITAWVDENSLLTGNYSHVHYITEDGYTSSVVGNIIFTGTKGEDTADLTNEQIEYIKNKLKIDTMSIEEYLDKNKSEYNDGI